jgi:di/tricarboxylate transporter
MPLSFAAILGGTCTLIGTSTNLVVSGLAQESSHPVTFGFFDIAWIGIPVLVSGLAYIVLAAPFFLPDRAEANEAVGNPKEYMVAMRVEPDSPVVGRTVEQAGLRQLPGLFLVERQRAGDVIPAVGPTTKLEANDQLLFAGIVDSVVDLRKVRGLVPATAQIDKLVAPRPERRLVEVVVASRSTLAGMSIRETRFRTEYDAAIIAVHRGGERVRSKLGDIVLRPGDVLLVEASPRFVRRHRHDRSFALLREVEGSAPPRHERALIAAVITVVMVIVSATGLLPLLTASLLAATCLLVTRCLNTAQALGSIEPRVLLTIAASFAVGNAIAGTGLATIMADGLVSAMAPFGPVGVIAGLYAATALLSSVVTNNSAAALMYPFCDAAATASGLELKPILLVLMMAASASFSTPIGYQTNLMVYGPGKYRFSDFIRFGLPLQVVAGAVTVSVTTWLWL